jgi:hypothetical protein
MKSFLFFFLVFILSSTAMEAQSYKTVRITQKNGIVVKGHQAIIKDESLSFTRSSGIQETLPMSDIRFIEAKKGTAGYWALGCGGGCLLLSALTLASNNPTESGYSNSELLPGFIAWVAISAGIGLGIGALTDKYHPVYSSSTSSLQKFNLGVSSARTNRYSPKNYSLTLSYRF